MRPGLPDIPFQPTLPELLAQAVARFGDDDYVVMIDRRLSFREADEASRVLAKRLLDAGVSKGTRIGIILPTGLDWVVAWLAAGRIGAFPMLFPATYRPAELRRALRISDTAILFAAPTLLGKDYESFLEEAVPSLAGHEAASGPLRDPEVPWLREVWVVGSSDRAWATSIEAQPDSAPPSDISDELFDAVQSEVSPADPLLVIYTSGSTADPKAIVHTHGATIRKVQAELGICLPGSLPGRSFCAMPFFWVGGPQDLLGALHSGAAIVTQERADIGECIELLERERCTSILGWPTVYQQLREEPTFASRDLSGLDLSVATPLVSSKGDPINMGMTETFGPHHNPDWFDYKVIDHESGAVLAAGEEGEFCVRGFGLMGSMYKREREEVFDADGYYHTGDRGYVENGRIWFTGRYSEMVKSGGANVAPLEVEQTLLAHDQVANAYVMGVPDGDRGECVAAAVVLVEGAGVGIDELRAHVNAQLSAYKVPARWVVLDPSEVPALANGKPDKLTMKERFA